MDNNKFEEFVKQNTRIVRRGETLTRKVINLTEVMMVNLLQITHPFYLLLK